jgi:hypothetical protein
MSMPTAVFLDTSVLDTQQYNFSSAALTTFVPACAKRGMTLLLPDPTEREIMRHIRDRSRDALSALEEARRKAPFLAKWKSFPPSPKNPMVEQWEVYDVARKEWEAFLKNFKVVRLGYDGLDIRKVMNWYDKVDPPFKEGKKRKEFPDAFAVSMLEEYAEKQRCCVAVVSADDDMKAACDRFASLLHFRTLPPLTELLLSDDDRVERLRQSLSKDMEKLTETIVDQLAGLSFYHANDRFDIVNTDYDDIDVSELSIVAVGDRECTITFDAIFRASHDLRWEDSGDDEGPGIKERTVREMTFVPATAKVSFDQKTEQILAVTYFTFEEPNIRVTETPYPYW